MRKMLGRDSSKNTPQVPHGFNSYINSEEEGVIAGILCDMAFCQMAYGQPVETCVIVSNTPKAPTL